MDYTKYVLKDREELAPLLEPAKNIFVISCNKCFKEFESVTENDGYEFAAIAHDCGKNVTAVQNVDFLCNRIISEKKAAGCTIFLTTHNMEEATKLCDHIVLLNEGRIVESGRPEEICRRYDHHKKIKLHLNDGEDIEYERNGDTAEEIFALLKAGSVETIHSTEPTLESVFLELTGRELEELPV